MSDLLTVAREHDLPPKWDGRCVVWLGWEYAPVTTAYLHQRGRDVCPSCGMPTYERGFPCWSTNWGMLADSPRLTPDDYANEEAARDRLPWRAKGKMPRHWWRSLCAFRCHDCQIDSVWDTEADEMWTLDHTDYGDDGSVA